MGGVAEVVGQDVIVDWTVFVYEYSLGCFCLWTVTSMWLEKKQVSINFAYNHVGYVSNGWKQMENST